MFVEERVSQLPVWRGGWVGGESRGGRLKIFGAGGRSGAGEGAEGLWAAGGAWCGQRGAGRLTAGVAAKSARQR